MIKTQKDILNLIGQVIYDKKGINILALDMKGSSTIADFMVIAEGNVDRHVMAIGREITDVMRKNGIELIQEAGLQFGDWAVLDFSGVMVHIFSPGLREKYALEKLWVDSDIVDLNIDISRPATPQAMR